MTNSFLVAHMWTTAGPGLLFPLRSYQPVSTLLHWRAVYIFRSAIPRLSVCASLSLTYECLRGNHWMD